MRDGKGVGHVGNDHQPILPPVVHDCAVGYSFAETPLDLRRMRRPADFMALGRVDR
jgi:hypothetical protein